jgi:hypothetical protein
MRRTNGRRVFLLLRLPLSEGLLFSRGLHIQKCLEENRSRVCAVTLEPGLLAWKARAAICCKSHVLSQHEERATRGAWKISVTDDRLIRRSFHTSSDVLQGASSLTKTGFNRRSRMVLSDHGGKHN